MLSSRPSLAHLTVELHAARRSPRQGLFLILKSEGAAQWMVRAHRLTGQLHVLVWAGSASAIYFCTPDCRLHIWRKLPGSNPSVPSNIVPLPTTPCGMCCFSPLTITPFGMCCYSPFFNSGCVMQCLFSFQASHKVVVSSTDTDLPLTVTQRIIPGLAYARDPLQWAAEQNLPTFTSYTEAENVNRFLLIVGMNGR